MTAIPGYADAAAPSGHIFFERVLLPHRSLPPRGFHILMVVLGLIASPSASASSRSARGRFSAFSGLTSLSSISPFG